VKWTQSVGQKYLNLSAFCKTSVLMTGAEDEKKTYRYDPALAGSVVLTTLTDVIGILAFLGMATLFLL